jgi:hypothetical protein
MLKVANKPIVLSVVMLNVVMLSVVTLNVVAPKVDRKRSKESVSSYVNTNSYLTVNKTLP